MAAMKLFEFKGAVYDTDPHYYDWDKERRFPIYAKIAEVPMGTREFPNVRAAGEWFTSNYPCLYRGGTIREIGGSGDFICYAVPGAGD